MNWDTFLLNVFMIQSWVPNSSGLLNLAAWSVSVEVFFYVLFPFLLKGINAVNLNTLGLILLGVGIWIAYHDVVLPLSLRLNLPAGLRYLPVFVVGVLSGVVFRKVPNPLPNFHFNGFVIHGSVVALASILMLYIYGVYFQNVNSGNDSIAVMIFTLFVLVLAWDNSFVSRLVSSKILLILGEISYGVYILQFPVRFWFGELWRVLGLQQDEFVVSLFFIPVLIGIAYLSFQFIEVPIRVFVKSYFERRTSRL